MKQLKELFSVIGLFVFILLSIIGLFHLLQGDRSCQVQFSNGQEVHVLVGEWQ
jgi:hypothetical protein